MAQLDFDYTTNSDISKEGVAKTSLLNDFKFVDAQAVDQEFEDLPQRKVLAVDSNTGNDIYGHIETSRSNQEGFYRIVLPVIDPATGAEFVALEIMTSAGGAGGEVTAASFFNMYFLPGAAPGGNQETIVPGYVNMPDLPTSNQGAGYLWVDGAAGNVIKMGT